MPRKTRHQKILAELRSLKKELQVPQATTTDPTNSPAPDNQTKVTSPVNVSPINTIKYNYTYLAKDLRKVAVLATIAILIEVVLSLTLNMGFANLLRVVKLG